MNYRGKGGKATDGDKVWQTGGAREHVGSPAGYKPPADPFGDPDPAKSDKHGAALVGCFALFIVMVAALCGFLFAIGLIRALWGFAFGG